MYELKVSDHVMIAHSLPDPFFGPAQGLHGATFNVQAAFRTTTLNAHQVVIDIGEALGILREVLQQLAYRNLDEMEVFQGKLTTTEFMAYWIHKEVARRAKSIFKGELCVRVVETPLASASFTAPVP